MTNTQSEKHTELPVLNIANDSPHPITIVKPSEYSKIVIEPYVNQHYGLKAENKKLKDALQAMDNILVWMANKEADYGADELRAMAAKCLQFKKEALSGDK
jgi:hypothetical protein